MGELSIARSGYSRMEAIKKGIYKSFGENSGEAVDISSKSISGKTFIGVSNSGQPDYIATPGDFTLDMQDIPVGKVGCYLNAIKFSTASLSSGGSGLTANAVFKFILNGKDFILGSIPFEINTAPRELVLDLNTVVYFGKPLTTSDRMQIRVITQDVTMKYASSYSMLNIKEGILQMRMTEEL